MLSDTTLGWLLRCYVSNNCGCRARRKVEEARAKERYEEYVKQKAQEEVARREAEAAAALKAAQDVQRRQLAAEAFKKRQVGPAVC